MDKFDEYKFFCESTERLSDRRQAATPAYVGINAAILGAIAFVVKDVALQRFDLLVALVPLFAVGIVLCIQWYKVIAQSKSLIGWRYEQLMSIEKEIEGSYQMYNRELEYFLQSVSFRKGFSFSRLEVWPPRMFVSLYIVFGVVLAIVAVR